MPRKSMTAKYLIATVLIPFFLNVGSSVMAQEQQSTEDLVRASITKEKSLGLRLNPKLMFHSGFTYIGDLVYWKSIFPLADNQKVTVKSLDALLWKAKVASMSNDADYMDTNPLDYKEYMDRNKRRRKAAVKHGQLMTLAGLLTHSQANAVIQYYLSTQQANAFHVKLMQDLMGFTKAQRSLLAQAQSDYNKNTHLRRFQKEFDSASMAVLTPAQKTMWKQLTAKRPLLRSAPAMPLPSEAEQKLIAVKEASAVFRAITHLQDENKLHLSEKQEKFLNDLYIVTQRGLFWIESADASQGDAAKYELGCFVLGKAEFLKHAGQVALQGILTEHQAKQVQDVK